MRYRLTVEASASGRAAIDAENAALNILRGQYDIDSPLWDVAVRTEPDEVTVDGQVQSWKAEAYACKETP